MPTQPKLTLPVHPVYCFHTFSCRLFGLGISRWEVGRKRKDEASNSILCAVSAVCVFPDNRQSASWREADQGIPRFLALSCKQGQWNWCIMHYQCFLVVCECATSMMPWSIGHCPCPLVVHRGASARTRESEKER